MNRENIQDNRVLDFFMDDSQWLEKIIKGKKKPEKERKTEGKPAIIPPEDIRPRKDSTLEDKNKLTEAGTYENHDTAGSDEKQFGEVDYAILKSIAYDFKSTTQISKALQIRAAVIEKHIFKLIKNGFIKYFQYCVLTSKGKDAIIEFEGNNPEDVWRPIDEFIVSVVEHNKENKVKLQKMIDTALLISIIILIILIIYFGVL
ncbi:MAG: hypothetical protein O8C62_10490 [Candidatus Methanoperedens sp.]|nr:hypothetical protein [Candidatus Methanoperedens sp.]